MVMEYLYSLLAVALWSVNFVIADIVSSKITPIELSFYRWLVAFMVLSPFMRSVPKSVITVVRDRVVLWSFIVASLLGISIFNTLIYMAGRYTSSINMSLIAVTSPVFITVIIRNKYSTWVIPLGIFWTTAYTENDIAANSRLCSSHH